MALGGTGAEHWRNSCVDTCHIWLPKTLKGHSLKFWVPVRVDCVSGQEQLPEAPRPRAAGKQMSVHCGQAVGS